MLKTFIDEAFAITELSRDSASGARTEHQETDQRHAREKEEMDQRHAMEKQNVIDRDNSAFAEHDANMENMIALFGIREYNNAKARGNYFADQARGKGK